MASEQAGNAHEVQDVQVCEQECACKEERIECGEMFTQSGNPWKELWVPRMKTARGRPFW